MSANNKYYEFIVYAEKFIDKKRGVPQNFSDIWKYICKELNLTKEESEELVGEFQLTLTLHKKFLYLGTAKKDLWNLKKYYSTKEIKKIEKRNLFYDNDDEIDLESDMVDYLKLQNNNAVDESSIENMIDDYIEDDDASINTATEELTEEPKDE